MTSPSTLGWSSTPIYTSLSIGFVLAFLLVFAIIAVIVWRHVRLALRTKQLSANMVTTYETGSGNINSEVPASSTDETSRYLLDVAPMAAALNDVTDSNGFDFFLKVISSPSSTRELHELHKSCETGLTSGSGYSNRCPTRENVPRISSRPHNSHRSDVMYTPANFLTIPRSSSTNKTSRSGNFKRTTVRDEMTSPSVMTCSCNKMAATRQHNLSEFSYWTEFDDRFDMTSSTTLPRSHRCVVDNELLPDVTSFDGRPKSCCVGCDNIDTIVSSW